MNFKNISKNIIIWSVIVFLCGLSIRIYTLSLKKDLHEDEALTVVLSNYSEMGWSILPEVDKAFTGKFLKQLTYWNDGRAKDVLSDIKNLYIYTRDDSHSDIYYILTRLAFAGVDDFSIKNMVIRTGVLNLILFSFAFFFMFKLLAILFKNRQELIPFGLFVAFFNTAAISTTCYFRPYQLQQAAFILVTYYFVKLLLNEKINIYKISFSIALAFLSGYYSLIYVGILAIVLFIKNINKMLLAKIAGLSVIFTTICYPVYFLGLASYRAVESLARSVDFAKNLYYSFINLPLIYLKYLFSISLLIYLIYLGIEIFKNKLKTDETEKLIPLVFVLSFLWTVIVLVVAPYKILRYIMPAFPLLSLIISYIISHYKKVFIQLIIVITIFSLNYCLAVKFLKNPNIGKYIPIISRLDFLKNRIVDKFLFEENINLPVVILKPQENPTIGEVLQISDIMPYFNDNQFYVFVNPNTKIEYPVFYMLISKFPKENYSRLFLHYYEKHQILKFQNCSKLYTCLEIKNK